MFCLLFELEERHFKLIFVSNVLAMCVDGKNVELTGLGIMNLSIHTTCMPSCPIVNRLLFSVTSSRSTLIECQPIRDPPLCLYRPVQIGRLRLSTLFGRNCSYNPILPLPPLSTTQLLVHWYPSWFDFSPSKIGESGYLKTIMIKIYRSKGLPENVHSGAEHSKTNIAPSTSGPGF